MLENGELVKFEENLMEIWQFKRINNASAEMYMFNEVYCEINVKCEATL